jgi:hypothetical protein
LNGSALNSKRVNKGAKQDFLLLTCTPNKGTIFYGISCRYKEESSVRSAEAPTMGSEENGVVAVGFKRKRTRSTQMAELQ